MLTQLYPVIVNWNLQSDTIACLDSLLSAGISLQTIILVDNASTDGSSQAFRNQYGSELRLIENTKNLGYAGGLNLGIQQALGLGAEWLFLLNNDTLAAKDLFSQLECVIQESPSTLIWSPLIRYYHDQERIWATGDRLIPGSLLTYSLGRNQLDRGQFPSIVPVDFITGCAMLVHRTVFDRCGFFSTRYFMYAEEVDFLWRARLAGYHPSVATRAVIWHKVSASSASEPTQRRYWRIVNQVRFYRKYASSLQKPGLFLYTLLRSVVIAGKSWVTGQRGSAGMSLTAWADGWLKDTPRINP